MNNGINQRFNEIKTDVQAAISRFTEGAAKRISRTWGHLVKHVTPNEATPTQTRTNATFQSVDEQKSTKPAPAIQAKALPKTPPEIKAIQKARAELALQNVKLQKEKRALTAAFQAKAGDPFKIQDKLSSVSKDIENVTKELQSLKTMLTFVKTTKGNEDIKEESISKILEELNSGSQEGLEFFNIDDLTFTSEVEDEGISKPEDAEISKPEMSIVSDVKIKFAELKDLVASINDDQKLKTRSKGLKVGEQTPLEAKIIKHTIGQGTPKALNAVLNQLASFAKTEEIHADEILEVIYTFESQDWTQKALENPKIKEKMTILTQYLHTKMNYELFSESYEHLEMRAPFFKDDTHFLSNLKTAEAKVEEFRGELTILNDLLNNPSIFPNQNT